MTHLRKLFVFIVLSGLPLLAQNLQIISLPPATVGMAYKVPLKIQVTIPFQLAKSVGSIPEGLQLIPIGTIEGTPKRPGEQVFVLTITDGDGNSQSHAFRIDVADPVETSTPTNPEQATARLVKKKPSNTPSANEDDRFQLIGGVEQGGVSSVPSQTNAFLSAFLHTGGNGSLRTWGRIRLLGSPTASTGGVISTFQNPTGQIKNFDTQKVGQAVDFVFGPEVRLTPSDGRRYALFLVGGIGATTPLSSQDVASRFKVPLKSSSACADVISRFSAQNGYPTNLILPNTDPANTNCLANGITVLDFNRQERTSFLRKYGVGIRLTDTWGNLSGSGDKSATSSLASKGTVDFGIGQDESITGGKLHGWVFRVDGVHTLPVAGNLLYLFGTAAIRITRNHDLRTLILDPDTSGAAPSAANVALLPLKQPDKDFYRFGVGLDFIKLIKAMTGKSNSGDKQANQKSSSNGSNQ